VDLVVSTCFIPVFNQTYIFTSHFYRPHIVSPDNSVKLILIGNLTAALELVWSTNVFFVNLTNPNLCLALFLVLKKIDFHLI